MGGEWIRGLGLCFTNPVRTGGLLDVTVLPLVGSFVWRQWLIVSVDVEQHIWINNMMQSI